MLCCSAPPAADATLQLVQHVEGSAGFWIDLHVWLHRSPPAGGTACSTTNTSASTFGATRCRAWHCCCWERWPPQVQEGPLRAACWGETVPGGCGSTFVWECSVPVYPQLGKSAVGGWGHPCIHPAAGCSPRLCRRHGAGRPLAGAVLLLRCCHPPVLRIDARLP